MFKILDHDDLERIAHALEQFRHNPAYMKTYAKVLEIIEAKS